MGTQTGIYQDASGGWHVDRVHRGERIRGRFRSHNEASAWLTAQVARIDARGSVAQTSMTLAHAATRYLLEEEASGKASLVTETYLLAPVVEFCGALQLDEVHDATLKPFVEARLAAGRSHKTVNLALGVVRRILNVAARRWRADLGGGRTAPVLHQVPLLTMLPLTGHQREPQPLTWNEQRELLALLPPHLARMTTFTLNTGVRDDVVCRLRWDWEIRVELGKKRVVSVFEVPRDAALVRKKSRRDFDYVVCNSVAQSVIEGARGQHDEFVFVWRRERLSETPGALRQREGHEPMPYSPVETMNNTAWQTARKKAGLPDLHVHDLRHTVGLRLREAGVPESTVADVLWHRRREITAHYSQAQVRELYAALELIREETGLENRSLRSLAREARGRKSPRKVPTGASGSTVAAEPTRGPTKALRGR